MRVRTTHVGSLPRPDDLLSALLDRESGGPQLDPDVVADAVRTCVDRQVHAGIDIVNDGELAKISYVTYVRDRLTGFTPAEASPARRDPYDEFPEFTARTTKGPAFGGAQIPVCTGAITYPDTCAVEADIARLHAGLAGHSGQEAFLNAASPGVVALFMRNEHYPDRESYLAAIGNAMKTEYDAVHRAGFLLQLDCPDLAVSRASFPPDEDGLRAFRELVAVNVAVLNHAVRDIPAERIRLHVCWGNSEGPHTRDVPLADLLDLLLTARAGVLSFEGANPRHGHEWEVFADAAVPDDLVIMPGVIDSTTNFVEHPSLVAQRIANYVGIVGADRVVASTDCGLATFATGEAAVDARIAWAKLDSLVRGAALASRHS
jgi:5-methyltetrahydropteroyltriglutamate--homocysteine methyltransferase